METSGYRLLLPEGTLDYFIISDVKESSTEIVIYLEEKNEVPGEYSSMQVTIKQPKLSFMSRVRRSA